MRVLVPAGDYRSELNKDQVRSNLQATYATPAARRDGIPLDGAPVEECLDWAVGRASQVGWQDLVVLAMNDPSEAPRLLWELDLRHRLTSDAYEATHRIYLGAGFDAMATLGPTRWRQLFLKARFTMDDLKASPPDDSVLLFTAAAEPPDLLASFTPSAAQASARAGVLSASGRPASIFALDTDPRRLLSVTRPGAGVGCDNPWACNDADVVVDLRRIATPPLPVDIDVFDLGVPCACETLEIPWIGSGRVENIPFPT